VELSQVNAGSVFTLPSDPDRPLRILMHSDDYALYDAWWPRSGEWGLADTAGTRKHRVTYYAVPTSILVARACYLRAEPLSEAEFALHRPDLPVSIGQCDGLEWTTQIESPAQVVERASDRGCHGMDSVLDAPEICLFPFGRRGSRKAGVCLRPDSESGFTVAELIAKAMSIQARQPNASYNDVHGIGIHRTGLELGVPSYYLWGNRNQMHSA
jgi:hypothetical protein